MILPTTPKFQLAIFAAHNYWNEVETNSQQRQKQGKKSIGKKGKTSAIVGNMGGVNEKYAQYAHELLEIDAEFFYNTFFIKRYSLTKNEINDLLADKNNKNRIKEIVDEMKKIVSDNDSVPLKSSDKPSLYKRAKKIVDDNHKANRENSIRKVTASAAEAEEIQNTLLSMIKAGTQTENVTDDNNDVKAVTTNKPLCVITISQPLSESVISHLKDYVETNSNYTVEIQQQLKKECI